MAKITQGAAYCFTPSAFLGEKSGTMGGRDIPREITGTIVYINRPHRFFLVEAVVSGHVLRESFKY